MCYVSTPIYNNIVRVTNPPVTLHSSRVFYYMYIISMRHTHTQRTHSMRGFTGYARSYSQYFILRSRC